MKKSTVSIGFAVLAAQVVVGAEYWVNQESGDDKYGGTEERPFRTFHRALEALRGGDTLHIQPTKAPYAERFGELKLGSAGGRCDGTPERPTVIDGHGATLSAFCRYPVTGWTDRGNGVWGAKPRSNAITSWCRGYYLSFPCVKVRTDGGWTWFKPVKSREGLGDFEMHWTFGQHKTEKGMARDADWGTLYVKLPAGMTPETNEIWIPQADNLVIGANYCVVRNINFEWSTADCIDSHRTKGSVVENVSVEWCLDQCISAHSTKDLTVRYSYFAHALVGNVLDVSLGMNEPAHVKYLGCVFGEGTGVNFKGFGTNCLYEVESCVIRDQARQAVGAQHDVRVEVRNCVATGCRFGVCVDDTGSLLAEDCDFSGCKDAFTVWSKSFGPGRLTFRRCVFAPGQKMVLNGKEVTRAAAEAAGVVFENCSFEGPKPGLGSALAGIRPAAEWTKELLREELTKKGSR